MMLKEEILGDLIKLEQWVGKKQCILNGGLIHLLLKKEMKSEMILILESKEKEKSKAQTSKCPKLSNQQEKFRHPLLEKDKRYLKTQHLMFQSSLKSLLNLLNELEQILLIMITHTIKKIILINKDQWLRYGKAIDLHQSKS